MSIKPVRLFTDSILHKPTKFITDFTDIQDLAESMLSTMYANNGIGLAAPQVGIAKQLFIANIENKSKIIMVANPKIICYNNIVEELAEGCLSAPGVLIKMKRPTLVEFEYSKLNGDRDKMKLEGFDARIFFHEWCHLQGQVITDSLMKL